MNLGKIILNIAIALIIVPIILIGGVQIAHELSKWLSSRYKNLDSHQIHRQLAIVTILISLPFICCGSYIFLSCDYSLPGVIIFLLGLPLTLIALKIDFFLGWVPTCDDNVWMVPLISFLFILQWVIWGQVIALNIRRLREGGKVGEAPTSEGSTDRP